MLELHHFPSTAAFAPHLLLEEIGVPFRLRDVNLDARAHRAPEHLQLNPNGLIPVLVDGDLVLYETAAILLHLADCHAGFAPAPGTPERAHYYKWMAWLSNTLQPMLGHYFHPEHLGRDPADTKARAEALIAPLLDQLDAELARHGGPWLLGAHYTAVDPLAFTVCRWTRMQARPARVRPALGAYLQRVFDRPATRRAVARERLAEPYF